MGSDLAEFVNDKSGALATGCCLCGRCRPRFGRGGGSGGARRSRLFEAVWSSEFDGESNVIEVYINYLRNKLEQFDGDRLIHTIRGRGYMLGDKP